jgi:hypothetical protein
LATLTDETGIGSGPVIGLSVHTHYVRDSMQLHATTPNVCVLFSFTQLMMHNFDKVILVFQQIVVLRNPQQKEEMREK